MMPVRLVFAVAAITFGMVVHAPAAGAATLRVDDDRAQCPRAQHQTIQSAVDAAAAGDVILVCAGVYREQVQVPQERRGIGLVSQPRHAATIAAPDALATLPHALMVLRADRMKLIGFQFIGPLPDVTDCDRHLHAAAVAVPAGSPAIQHNRFTGFTLSGCGRDAEPAPAVHVGDIGGEFGAPSAGGPTIIDRNTIDGDGITIESYRTRVTRNIIRGPGGNGVFLFDEAGGNSEVRGNDISGQFAGVAAGGSHIGFFKVRGNYLHNNERGISISVTRDGPRAPVFERNIVERNEFGLYVDFTAPGDAILRNNLARLNEQFDCVDELGSGIWQNNRGTTSNPPGLCRP